MHYAILETSIKTAAIVPLEATNDTHFVVDPITCVFGAIGPKVIAQALLHSVFEVAMVVATIRLNFYTFSILFSHIS